MCFLCISLKTDIDHLLNFLAGVFLASCPHIWVCQKLGQPESHWFVTVAKKKCKVLGFTPFLDTPILAFEIFLRLGQFPQPSAPAFGAKNRLCGVAAGWTNIYFGDDQ